MRQTIIAQNNDPRDEFCLGFIVDTIESEDGKNESLDVIAALRNAARDFAETDEGKEVLEEACGSFNWGDLANHLPNEICEQYGVHIVDTFQTDLVVTHNEMLVF